MKSRFLLICLMLGLAVLLAACGGKEESSTELGERGAVDSATGVAAPDFEWNIITKPLVTFYYEPDDSLAFKADALATRIDQVLRTVATGYGWENPTPIEFYCYRDVESMAHYTNRPDQFFVGNKFFYGYGPNYGPLVPKYVAEHLPTGPSNFDFVNEGMLLMLDFSGRNYNQAAFNFFNDGTLSQVAELTDSSLYANIGVSRRAVTSASFCSYLFDTFGIDTTHTLMRWENSDFKQAAEEVLGKSIDEIQDDWVIYITKHTNEMERIREVGGES